MTITDYNNNAVMDNRWLHGRLVKQKSDEIEERKRIHGS